MAFTSQHALFPEVAVPLANTDFQFDMDSTTILQIAEVVGLVIIVQVRAIWHVFDDDFNPMPSVNFSDIQNRRIELLNLLRLRNPAI
jgi:hypothetical protein